MYADLHVAQFGENGNKPLAGPYKEWEPRPKIPPKRKKEIWVFFKSRSTRKNRQVSSLKTGSTAARNDNSYPTKVMEQEGKSRIESARHEENNNKKRTLDLEKQN